MRAYKVLTGGCSTFTGWRWPLPTPDAPGEWVQASGPIALCQNGVHASTVDQLPQWLGAELWEIELAGDIVEADPALVAGRGRLLRRVETWNGEAQAAFAGACATRARDAGASGAAAVLLQTIETMAARGLAAAAGYWSGVLASERATGRRSGADYDAAFARERSMQAQWLRSELGLT